MTPAAPLAQLLQHSADAVQAVQAGRSPDGVLAALDGSTRPGVQALTFHVLRQLGAATELRRLLVPKRPPARVDALLCSALALLWPPGEPPYAAHTLVDQAVAAARARAPAAAGLVNAVLRRFLREPDRWLAAAIRAPAARWNHPAWWIDRMREDWPGDWQALLEQADRHPPMTLRVNRRRCSGADYVQRLAAQDRPARLLGDPAFGGQAVVLAQPCPV
jgi:16S rRNA (cytosine967-C5)-methyltransferase